MEKKKLEDFITRLSDPNLPEDQQSFILQSEDDDVCAGSNSGTCINYDADSCGGEENINARCTNHGVCGGATNEDGCKNLNPKQVDSFCFIRADFFHSCG